MKLKLLIMVPKAALETAIGFFLLMMASYDLIWSLLRLVLCKLGVVASFLVAGIDEIILVVNADEEKGMAT